MTVMRANLNLSKATRREFGPEAPRAAQAALESPARSYNPSLTEFFSTRLAEPARAAAFLVRLYQLILSPLKRLLLGPHAACRFYPSCSQYARESFRRHGFVGGCELAVRRIVRCHPFHPGGFDPVPEAPRGEGEQMPKIPKDSVDRVVEDSAGIRTDG